MTKTLTNHMGVLTHYNRALSVALVEKVEDTALGVYAASEYGLIYTFALLSGVIQRPKSDVKVNVVPRSFFGAYWVRDGYLDEKLTYKPANFDVDTSGALLVEAMDPIQKERLRAKENEDMPRIVLL